MAEGTLKEAIDLARAGHKKEAGVLFNKIVKDEPGNETAWLWLASCVEKPDQKIYCLRKALAINPDNPKAQQALEKLEQTHNQPSVSEIVAAGPPVPIQEKPQPVVVKKKRSPLVFMLGVSVICIFVVWVVMALTGNLGSNRAASEPRAASPTRTPKPTTAPPLMVPAGQLSAHKDEITRDRIINVYKENGSLDDREDDLKELSLDWFYYRQKIVDYQAAGDTKKAEKAQVMKKRINAWMDVYHQDDVQTMLNWVQENGWRR